MIKVHHDDELNRLGFKLLLAVHDELIGECPIENQDAVAERLSEVMKISALPEVTLPFKCDAECEPAWYFSECCAMIQAEFNDLQAQENSFDKAFNIIENKYSEFTSEELKNMIRQEV